MSYIMQVLLLTLVVAIAKNDTIILQSYTIFAI